MKWIVFQGCQSFSTNFKQTTPFRAFWHFCFTLQTLQNVSYYDVNDVNALIFKFGKFSKHKQIYDGFNVK